MKRSSVGNIDKSVIDSVGKGSERRFEKPMCANDDSSQIGLLIGVTFDLSLFSLFNFCLVGYFVVLFL